MGHIEESAKRLAEGLRSGKYVRCVRTDFILPNGEAAYTATPKYIDVQLRHLRRLVFAVRKFFKAS
jgi:hypothetical protein